MRYLDPRESTLNRGVSHGVSFSSDDAFPRLFCRPSHGWSFTFLLSDALARPANSSPGGGCIARSGRLVFKAEIPPGLVLGAARAASSLSLAFRS